LKSFFSSDPFLMSALVNELLTMSLEFAQLQPACTRSTVRAARPDCVNATKSATIATISAGDGSRNHFLFLSMNPFPFLRFQGSRRLRPNRRRS